MFKGASPLVEARIQAESDTRPNIILLMIDDMRHDDMLLGFNRSITGTVSRLEVDLINKGATFSNFFNTTPLCCPARASFLTGQYSHNHRVYGNNYFASNTFGGMRRFLEDGHEENNIAIWMDDAGYNTVLIGKYLNGYPNKHGMAGAYGLTESYTPTGWAEWYGVFHNEGATTIWGQEPYTRFRINQNGNVIEYGESDPAYLTDVETELVVDYIDRNGNSGVPFFIYLAPYAPHGPIQAPPHYDGAHDHVIVDPPPAFNEADISDKPQYVQDGAYQHVSNWGGGYQNMLDMTLSLDDMVGAIIDELAEEGILDNTYIFFMADNGLMRGEHQIKGGKSVPYEESIRSYLWVRGPGIPNGVTYTHLVGNIDMAPTFLDLAGSSVPAVVNGESLLGPMTGSIADEDWRDAILIEFLSEESSPNHPHKVPKYVGLRMRDEVYVEYEPGDRELYDLAEDPYQLENQYNSAVSGWVDYHEAWLNDLANCVGQSCVEAAYAPNWYFYMPMVRISTPIANVDAVDTSP